jgi:hypothetical protein
MPGRFEDNDRDHFPARPATSNGALLIGLLVAGGLLSVVICGGGLTYLLMARGAAREREAAARAEAVEAQAATAREAGPAADVGDGSKLRTEFRENPGGAARQSADHRVGLTAAVAQVDPNEGEPCAVLAGPIVVLPAPAESTKFGGHQVGVVVTVEGTVVRPAGAAPLMMSGAVLVPPRP